MRGLAPVVLRQGHVTQRTWGLMWLDGSTARHVSCLGSKERSRQVPLVGVMGEAHSVVLGGL